MQIKTRDHTSYQTELPSQKKNPQTNAGERVEKREPSYTVGENVEDCIEIP